MCRKKGFTSPFEKPLLLILKKHKNRRLDIDLDSGYELEDVKMKITFEDLATYETEDIHQGVRYALGFFNN